MEEKTQSPDETLYANKIESNDFVFYKWNLFEGNDKELNRSLDRYEPTEKNAKRKNIYIYIYIYIYI